MFIEWRKSCLFWKQRKGNWLFWSNVYLKNSILSIQEIIQQDFCSLNLKVPQYTNPADFYIDSLGVDMTDEKASRKKIEVNNKKILT